MDMRLLMKQAQRMQTEMQAKQRDMRIEGTAGGAMVKVTLNGAKELLDIFIAKEAINTDDPELLQDLIVAAFKDAFIKVNNTVAKQVGNFNLM